MALQQDMIVDIPAERVKFFGTTGKMLLPSTITVSAMIDRVPTNMLITTDELMRQLTAKFNVQGTCPVTTRKALKAIAHDNQCDVAYWRVVNKDGGLMAGVEGQLGHLQKEGFVIDTTGKKPKVKDFSASLVYRDVKESV